MAKHSLGTQCTLQTKVRVFWGGRESMESVKLLKGELGVLKPRLEGLILEVNNQVASPKILQTSSETPDDLLPLFSVPGVENSKNTLLRKTVATVSGKPESVAS